MKQKLLIALLATAAVAGLLAGNVAADDNWGTGGWDVPKQRTTWNPDGVWMEGEYYTVDLDSQPEGTVNYSGVEDGWLQDFSFGMSWDEQYLYTYIMYAGGYTYGDQVWDGTCIQFSGTDYGAEGGDNRLEYGVTWNINEDCNETCNWYDWLNSGYGNGTNTDDFAVFIRDGWVVYEMRTPFEAFTTATVAEDAKMGVCYVIGVGNGDGQRIQTQIGNGVAEYKDAKDHCPITLVAEQPEPERTGQPYYILFHNIGNGQVHSDYEKYYENTDDHDSGYCSWQWEATDDKDASAYIGDLLKTLPEEKRSELLEVTGYDFAGFRLAYYSEVDGVWTEKYDMDLYGVDDVVTLDEVKDYTFYDGCNYCIMFSAVYEPVEITLQYVDPDGTILPTTYTAHTGDYVIYYNYEKPIEDLNIPEGQIFHHWEILDKDGNLYTEDGEPCVMGDWWFVGDSLNLYRLTLDAEMVENCVVDDTLTIRAVYTSAETAIREGTIGDDNIPWKITADGTLTVGHTGDDVGDTMYSLPDWNNPFNYDMSVDNWLNDAIDKGEVNPWIKWQDYITALVIGDDIDYIGDYSFQALYKIEGDVVIPDGVKIIGEGAFQYNNFSSITIGEGVEKIEAYAFDGSYELTEIHIPASVSYIDAEAFKWCEKVEAFTVDADNQWYTADDGVLFTKDVTELIRYPWAKADTSYTVPDTVTVLKPTCFEASTNLTEIILPDGLESIGYWALANLNVMELVIPASVNSVQDSAFRKNYNLTDIYFQGNKPDTWEGSLLYLYDEDNDRDYLRSDLKIHYNAAAERWGDIVDEYGDNMVIDGGYAVRFVDDDGITELLDTQVKSIGDSIEIPSVSNTYYGRFNQWFAWNREYTMDYSSLTLSQNLLDEAGYDSNWDGINDTIVFQAEYSFYSNAPEYRAEGDIELDDGNVIHWCLDWGGTLSLDRLYDDDVDENVELAIPDYGDENLPPWHEYNTYIHGLNLGDNIVSIGNCAFRYLCALEGLNIPGNVKSIGADAFYIGANDFSEYFNNSSLQWIQLNDGLEHIGHNAFCNANVDNLWIPKTVTDIEEGAFYIFWNNRFEVDGENPNYYSTEDGALYRKEEDGTSTLMAYPARQNGGAYVQEDTSRIADGAFTYRTEITTIYLPDGLKTIGEEAFSQTFNLIELHIPASVESIGSRAFHEAKSDMVLYFYGDAPSIPDDVAFQDNFTICYIEGTKGWDDVKARFPLLNYDTFSAGDNYASGVIDYDWNDEHIYLNWYITKDGWLKVEGAGSIPDHEHPWWEYLAYVRKVDIDDNITYIGNDAFCDLRYVDQINLPKNLKYVGDSAFNADGSSGNNIGAWILPGKLTTIRKYAFGNLGITKVTIPASLQHIDSGWAFFDNPITTYAVENGSINFGVDSYGALYELDENKNYVALVAYPRDAEYTSYTVPNGVTRLYGASIRNACNLTEVILPDTLEEIGNEALAHFYNDLRTLTIPASVKTIYSNAFRWGNKTSVTFLGNKPEFINDGENEGNQFWDNMDNQIVVYYYEGTTGWEGYDPQDINTYMLKTGEEPFVAQGYFWDGWDIQWTLDKNGVLNVYGSGEIPGNWGGYDWRNYMGEVKEIIIHEGITGIGNNMFYNCLNATKLTLPSTMKWLGNGVFYCDPDYGEGKLGALVLPEGLERIDYHAFYNCGLTKVTIPSTMKEFDAASFEMNPIKEYVVADGNPELATDDYGVLFWLWYDTDDNEERIEGTERLGALAAYPSGSSMTSYTVPETVGDICSWAFAYANNLTSLNLNQVWGYSDHVIEYCDNLTSLVLPENISWMSFESIYGNKNLKSITFAGRIPNFNEYNGSNDPFVNNADDLVIYYYADAENVENLQEHDLINQHNFVMLTHTNLKGDVNDDGKVDKDDLTILQQYYAGYNVTIANQDNADIDGENGLTRRDVMILARYLDNWGEEYSRYFN